MKNALVVFARAPEPGKVKTRIAKIIGDESAAELYAAMLHDTLELAQGATQGWIDWEVWLAFTPPDAFDASEHSLGHLWCGAKMAQCDGDLGQKMRNCFARLHENNIERGIIIGSDSPDLPDDILCDAFQALTHHDMVIGPATDGGFYLIGTRGPISPKLFHNVAWSTPDTLQHVLVNAAQLQLNVGCGPLWSDIDTPEDLQRLAHQLEPENSAPATRHWLASHNLLENI